MGAWVVHHQNKLKQVTPVTDFENIEIAGKLGTLLSVLSASQQSHLSHEAVAGLAKAAGISSKLELPTLVQRLKHERLIDVGNSGVEVLGVTTSAVLTHTGTMFEGLNPSPTEQAAIELAETASVTPIESKVAQDALADTFKLASGEMNELLAQAEEIGFIDSEEIKPGSKLYFNGNVFRKEAPGKVMAVLGSLTPEDQRNARELEQKLIANGCLTVDQAVRILGRQLFEKLHAIGMYDVNEVSNETEAVLYVTRPAAFGKFGDPFTDDALDMAKALVACLRYGMTRSSPSRGRIQMLGLLVRKLLNGQWVGPATAIGQDYKVLELKRVLEIRADRGYFSMRLLKMDVGEMALQVLTQGDASELSLPNFGAAITRYRRPEETRVIARRHQAPISKRGTRDILLSLRTGR
jgi:hypothetical protein